MYGTTIHGAVGLRAGLVAVMSTGTGTALHSCHMPLTAARSCDTCKSTSFSEADNKEHSSQSHCSMMQSMNVSRPVIALIPGGGWWCWSSPLWSPSLLPLLAGWVRCPCLLAVRCSCPSPLWCTCYCCFEPLTKHHIRLRSAARCPRRGCMQALHTMHWHATEWPSLVCWQHPSPSTCGLPMSPLTWQVVPGPVAQKQPLKKRIAVPCGCVHL